MTASPPQHLKRELGVFGAVMLGLGSIVGTGVFVSIAIALGIAGPAVLLSIAIAALLASCNALSSAQLAAAHPVSGGTYEYGYRLLKPTFGFTAGWMFLCAKSASAATAALGAAGYALHLAGFNSGAILPGLGFGIVLGLTALVLSGLRRSMAINIAIVSITLLALLVFIVVGGVNIFTHNISAHNGMANFTPFFTDHDSGALQGVLYASALMFVAYTGYGRIATMGEEVKNPRRTIPRAIIATLIISALLYILVAVALIGAVGGYRQGGSEALSATPLEVAAQALNFPGLAPLVAVGAVAAMLGVLLNLILGLSRVALAMGRRGDLPLAIGRLTAGSAPRSAIIFVGLIIAALTLIGDVKTTWSFSAFTVLIYYAITNLAALRLPKGQRLYPPFLSWIGLCGCVFLAFFLPAAIWLTGFGFILLGLLWQACAKKLWVHQGKG